MGIKEIMGILGLSRRAGKLCCGHDAVIESIVKDKATLVILSSDASERLKNEIKHAANYNGKNIEVIESAFLMQDFYSGIGKKSAVFSITDQSFKEKIKTLFGEEQYGSKI
ncbi:MAG: ribosomal L7Ae/L30e/S12e/Gadd45 family protein [Clostridia bacterium]|nr:ribosomal L7Ae/L30e/S12e/Gadd45 family protein [Clostridia bacterium]